MYEGSINSTQLLRKILQVNKSKSSSRHCNYCIIQDRWTIGGRKTTIYNCTSFYNIIPWETVSANSRFSAVIALNSPFPNNITRYWFEYLNNLVYFTLNQWSRFGVENLIYAQPIKKYSAFFWRKLITVHNGAHPVINHMNPIHTLNP